MSSIIFLPSDKFLIRYVSAGQILHYLSPFLQVCSRSHPFPSMRPKIEVKSKEHPSWYQQRTCSYAKKGALEMEGGR